MSPEHCRKNIVISVEYNYRGIIDTGMHWERKENVSMDLIVCGSSHVF
jgi:hypothetical protein